MIPAPLHPPPYQRRPSPDARFHVVAVTRERRTTIYSVPTRDEAIVLLTLIAPRAGTMLEIEERAPTKAPLAVGQVWGSENPRVPDREVVRIERGKVTYRSQDGEQTMSRDGFVFWIRRQKATLQ